MVTTFDRATAVRRVDDGRYAADLDAAFSIGGPLNGGYLMATVLRAVLDDSPHPHPMATSVNFLRVSEPGPAQVRVERMKQGRTAATARATLFQDDVPVIDTLVTSGTLDPIADPTWVGEPVGFPPVEDCVTPRSVTPDGQLPGFAEQVELRFDPATAGWLRGEPSGRMEMRGYLRLRESQDPDPRVLALAVDAMPPVVFELGAFGWAPTVELTWHMRAVPVPGWLAVRIGGRLVNDGWFDEDAEVWDASGRLVAQARQLARLGR